MIITHINGESSPTAQCSRFRLLVENKKGCDTYEICDAGDGEIIIRNLTSPLIAVRPRADNSLSIINIME